MGLVSGYNNDVFISYSHIDNQPFGDPRGGWVDIFHEQLQNFVNVHVGRRTKVWRDKRLTGAEVFSDEIEQQLRSSAVLVSVISPGYMQSEWCNRELVGFTKAAQDRGNLRVGNLQRVVKVLRLPVERSALPPLLDEVLGGQFYRVDPASGRARDLLLDPSADAAQVFRARVDDVAQDLSRLLGAMATSGGAAAAAPPASAADTVFLAWTTGDLERGTREAAPRTGSAKLSSRADRRPAARCRGCARKRPRRPARSQGRDPPYRRTLRLRARGRRAFHHRTAE